MRFIELIAMDPPRHLALHPRLTVVGGIGPSSAIAADLLAAFSGATDRGTGALVELEDGTRRDLAEVTVDVAQLVLTRADVARADVAPPDVPRPDLSRSDLSRSDLAPPDLPRPDVPRAELPRPVARSRAVAPVPPPAPPRRPVVDEQSLGPIDARRAEILTLLARPVPDATPVNVAWQGLQAATGAAQRSREQRVSLADAWTDVMSRLSLCPPVIAPSAEVLAQARDAVADAEAGLRRAQRDAGASPSADLAELDRVHALVDAAEARAARPLAGAAARRELAAAREREQAILDGLGFLSYMDRHLTEALFRPDAAAVDRCDQARAALDDAHGVLAELEVMGEEANRRERLEAEAAGYAAAAARYLGGSVPTDLADALRAAPDHAVETARAQLRAALVQAGVVPDGELAEAAERFLDQTAAIAAEQDHLRHELYALEAARAREVERISSLARDVEEPVDEPGEAERGEVERDEVERDEVERDEAVSYEEGKGLEILLLSHLASHRGSAEQGSVPLVLDDVFAGLSDDTAFGGLMLLEKLADSVQVLYLTDDPRLHRWTAGLGDRRAASHVTGWEPIPVSSPGLTIAAGIDLAQRTVAPAVAPPSPAPSAAPRRIQCQVCRHGIANAVCDRCALHLCEDHLIRTPSRREPGRTLCLQCGLVAAGVRRERR